MPSEYFLAHIWLIPLFPLAGAALMLFIGRRLPNAGVNVICVGSVFLAMIYAFGAMVQLIARPVAQRVAEVVLFDWVPAGAMHTSAGHLVNFNAQWGMLLDPLSAVMLCVVTGVGFLIHVYSTGYMAHEGGYYRFFGYLNLFMFSMLTLVLGNNLLLLFVGWEGVGLCSYLLIGFYFLRKSASDAGKKAFIVNRIGDAGFILGLFLLVGTLGTLRFTEIGPAIEAGGFAVGSGVMTAIALLAVRRRDGQVGADSAVRLAAGRHGRPHAGQRADSRGDDGDRGRVHGHAHERRLPACAAGHGRGGDDRRGDGASLPRPWAWCKTISSACWPIRR